MKKIFLAFVAILMIGACGFIPTPPSPTATAVIESLTAAPADDAAAGGSIGAVGTAAAPVDARASYEAEVDCVRLPIGTSLAEAERTLMLATLRHYNHHKERTAAALGISLKTLYNRLKEYAADETARRGNAPD